MDEILGLLKVLILSPFAGAGAIMGLFVGGELGALGGFWDAVGVCLVLAALHMPVGCAIWWLWQRPGQFFQHSWTTWLVLVTIAYGAGLTAGILMA